MTEDELIKRFPRISRDCIRANLSDQDSRPAPIVECPPGNGSLAKEKVKEGDPARLAVRVTATRARLLDEDNLCPKFHIDGLRYARILHSDAPDKVSIHTRQRKAAKGEAESILIEIYEFTQPSL